MRTSSTDDHSPRYTLRVVARRLGVPTATLRSWNHRYGVGPVGHSPGEHRLYSEADVAIVQHMHALIGEGATPRSAAQFAKRRALPASTDVAVVLEAALKLDTATVGRLLDGHLRHYGVVETWERLIRPAFDAIETRQLEGQGCIDVEHALSWTVARSLQRTSQVISEAPPAIILACTEAETHALTLEALRCALCESGCATVMLGAATPVHAVIDALGRCSRPATVVLSSQTEQTADLNAVRTIGDRGARVILAGPGWKKVRSAATAVSVNSLDDALRQVLATARPMDSVNVDVTS